VVDALHRKTQNSLSTVVITKMSLLKELEHLGVQLVSHGQASVQLSAQTLQSSIVDEIRINQKTDPKLQRIK